MQCPECHAPLEILTRDWPRQFSEIMGTGDQNWFVKKEICWECGFNRAYHTSLTPDEYWNWRATLGPHAGTADLIAKALAQRTLLSHLVFLPAGSTVLDIGCGSGETLLTLAQRFAVHGIGIDSSPEMIRAAEEKYATTSTPRSSLRFIAADFFARSGTVPADAAFTERTLINLPSWDAQQAAIQKILACLPPGGQYYMIENSRTGLTRLNQMRAHVELPPIPEPWHNYYFSDQQVAAFTPHNGRLIKCVDFSSTYYFLSRVINAKLTADEGRAPAYHDPINQLALALPALPLECGQGKLWVWERT